MAGYSSYYPYFQNLGQSNISWYTGAFANPSYTTNLFWMTVTYKFDPPLAPAPMKVAEAPKSAPPPSPPPPSPPPPPPPPPPKPMVQKITLDSKVLFDFDKAVLKPEGKAAIDSQVVGKIAQIQKLEVVLVTGHTDRLGADGYNQKLSERRADAVRNYLVSKGVPKDRIETIGMGEKQPIAGEGSVGFSQPTLADLKIPGGRVGVKSIIFGNNQGDLHVIYQTTGGVWMEAPGFPVAVTVESTPGTGSTFTVELPAMSLSETTGEAEPTAWGTDDAPSLREIRVLVVEDEADSRELLMETLSECGAEVVAVASCQEALAKLRQLSGLRLPHVIVSDLGMPKEDGYDLIRQIRALPEAEGGGIPAIALTGYANPEDRRRAMVAGYHGHVAKPMDRLAVITAIKRAALDGGFRP
jgi:outer membrane protein OmpA-like peptidoglycan-associated protein/CheY-like chemotaxis protein